MGCSDNAIVFRFLEKNNQKSKVTASKHVFFSLLGTERYIEMAILVTQKKQRLNENTKR
jgi:hypothetical protein